MPLPFGQTVFRLHTVKRKMVDNKWKIFQNRHDYLHVGDPAAAPVGSLLASVQLAEQHIMMPDVQILFTTCYQLGGFADMDLASTGRTHFHRVIGGRAIDPIDVPVEWPLVFQVRKLHPFGRATALMFRGVLRERDLLRFGGEKAYLRGDYEESGLTDSFFNSFMRVEGFTPVSTRMTFDTWDPMSTREITKWAVAGAVRLSSIEDAQRRKTFKANPYNEKAQALGDMVAVAGQTFVTVLQNSGATVQPEPVENIRSAMIDVQSQLAQVREYWEKGIEEDFAPCWRPTAGLDPFSQRARAILNRMENLMPVLLQQLGDMPANEDGSFDRVDLDSVSRQYQKLAVFYVLLMDFERWTGTPIPHPNLLGACG